MMKKSEKTASVSRGRKVDGRGLTDEAEYGKLQHRLQREGALAGRMLDCLAENGETLDLESAFRMGDKLRKRGIKQGN